MLLKFVKERNCVNCKETVLCSGWSIVLSWLKISLTGNLIVENSMFYTFATDGFLMGVKENEINIRKLFKANVGD